MPNTIVSQAAALARYHMAGIAMLDTAAVKVSVIVSSLTSAQLAGLQWKKCAVAAIRFHCRC
jgi:hypothetical protein